MLLLLCTLLCIHLLRMTIVRYMINILLHAGTYSYATAYCIIFIYVCVIMSIRSHKLDTLTKDYVGGRSIPNA